MVWRLKVFCKANGQHTTHYLKAKSNFEALARFAVERPDGREDRYIVWECLPAKRVPKDVAVW